MSFPEEISFRSTRGPFNPPRILLVEQPGSVARTSNSLPPLPEGAAHSSDQLTPDQLQKVAATINNTARPSLQANEQHVFSTNQAETDVNKRIDAFCKGVQTIDWGRRRQNTLTEQYAIDQHKKYLKYKEDLNINFEELLDHYKEIKLESMRNLQHVLYKFAGNVYSHHSTNSHLLHLYNEINKDKIKLWQVDTKFNEHQRDELKSTPQVNGNNQGCPPLVSSNTLNPTQPTIDSSSPSKPQVNGNNQGCPPLVSSNTLNPTQPTIDSSSPSDRLEEIAGFCEEVKKIRISFKSLSNEEKQQQRKVYEGYKAKYRIEFTSGLLYAQVGAQEMMKIQAELRNLENRIYQQQKDLKFSQAKNQASMIEFLDAFRKEIGKDHKNSFQSSKVQPLTSNHSLPPLKRSANHSSVEELSLPVSKKNKRDIGSQNSHAYSHLAPRQASLEQREKEKLMQSFLPSRIPPTQSTHSSSSSNSFAFQPYYRSPEF
jgi:hypothetical protein